MTTTIPTTPEAGAPLVLHAAEGPALLVPGGILLLVADYQRVGADLVLVGPDGARVVIADYFALDNPPDLMTAGGAVINADVARALAGPQAPGQYAQAGSVAGAAPIGKIEKLSGEVVAQRPDGTKVALAKGDVVYQGDVIITGDGAGIGIMFVDDTSFSLGAKGRMVLDEMVFDPGAKTGQSTFSVVQGAFSFVSGKVAKTGPDAMKVKTPVMTIGIRGTTVAGFAAAEGEGSYVTLLSDADGGAGQIVVYNQAGLQLLSVPNQTVQLASAFQDVPPPFTLTPAQIESRYGHAVAHRPEPGGAEGGERNEQDGPRGEEGGAEGEEAPAQPTEEEGGDGGSAPAEEGAAEEAPAEEAATEEAAEDEAAAEDATSEDAADPGDQQEDAAAAPAIDQAPTDSGPQADLSSQSDSSPAASDPGNSPAPSFTSSDPTPPPPAQIPETQEQVVTLPPPPPDSSLSNNASATGTSATGSGTAAASQTGQTPPAGTVTTAPVTNTPPAPPPNQAPQAGDDDYSVAEDGEVSGSVLGNDSDPEGMPLTAVLTSGPSNGSLSFDADGSFTYTPNPNFFGADSFSYSADDGTLQGAASVSITVTPVNDAPMVGDDSFSVAEDQALSGDVLSNDTDVEGDPLSASLVSGPAHGSLSFNSDGSFVYTPTLNYFGSDSFSYVVSDGKTESETASVSITVTPMPDVPLADDDSYSTRQGVPLSVDAGGVLSNDADVDGDPLSAVLVSGPSHGSLSLDGDGGFVYTPDLGFFGEDSFSYKASDGVAESEAASVSITVTRAPAPVAEDDSYSVAEDGEVSGGVLGNDTAAEGDTLSAVLVSGPSHGSLSFDGDGNFTYSPDLNYYGPDSFTYRASNGIVESDDATVSIEVTPVADAPVATDDAYSLGDGNSLTVSAAEGLLANDDDADGDSLSAVLVSGPSHGHLSLDADGGFTYTPIQGYTGTDSFTYHVSDGSLQSDVATVSLSGGYFDSNLPPEAESIPGSFVLEDHFSPMDTGVWSAWSGGGTFAPAEFPHGQALYFDEAGERYVTTGPLDVSNGGIVSFHLGLATGSDLAHFGASGPGENVVFQYSTDGGSTWVEIDRFGYGQEITSGGTFDSNEAVNAYDDNYWPWGDADTTRYQLWIAAETLEDYAGVVREIRHFAESSDTNAYDLQIYMSSWGPDSDLLNASDLDANHGENRTLVFDGTVNLAGTQLTIDIDDVFTYTGGNLLIDYVFGNFDGVGNFYDGPLWQAVDTNSVLYRVADHAVEGPDVLDWGAIRTELGFEANGWGQFGYYIPEAARTDSTIFRWRQEDHSGADADQWALDDVIIHLSAAVATDDVAFTYQLPDGLFTDPDGDDLTLTATMHNGDPLPDWLNFDSETGTFSGTPTDDDVGTLGLKVKATDPSGERAGVKFTITVKDANDAPETVGVLGDVEATEGTAFSYVVPNVFYDADGDALTYAATLADGNPLPAWLSFDDSTRTLSGTPANADVGSLNIRVTASDGTASTYADFNVTVGDIAHAPTAADDTYETNEDGALTVVAASGVLANDTDPDADDLSAVLVSGPSHGTLDLAADGSFVYTPDANFNGTDSFSYHADDGGQVSGDVIVTIDVSAVNDAPVLASAISDQTATEDSAFSFLVPAGTFTDVDGDTLTFGATLADGNPLPAWLSFDSGSRTFSGTPASGDIGSLSVRVTASDGSESVYDDFTLSVGGAPHAPVATDDSYSMNEDGTLSVVAASGVLANDSDADGDDLSAVLVSGPSHGTLSLAADGSFVYAPEANFNGTDSFSYHADDGGQVSGDVIVTIDVSAVNDAPVLASAISDQTATEDSAFSFLVPAGTFTDVDGDTLTFGATLADGNPLPAWLSFDSGSRTFSGTPASGDIGSLSVRVTASDGSESVYDDFTLSVGGAPHAPVATDDSYSMNEDGTLSVVAASGVLANDSDADGDDLSAVLVSGPSHGTLSLAADGSFVYAPEANFNGTDSFSYHADDGSQTSGEAVVTIAISPVNDAPEIAVNAGMTAVQGASNVLHADYLEATDVDDAAADIVFTLTAIPTQGTLYLHDGSLGVGATFSQYDLDAGYVTYVHSAGNDTADSFAFTLSDGEATPIAGTFAITVSDGTASWIGPTAGDYSWHTASNWNPTAPVGDGAATITETIPVYSSGALSLASLSVNGGGLSITGGTFKVSESLAVAADTVLSVTGGTFSLAGGVTLSGEGAVTFSGGSFSLAGDLAIGAAGTPTFAFDGATDVADGDGDSGSVPTLTNEQAELDLTEDAVNVNFANAAGARALLWATSFTGDLANAGELVANTSDNSIDGAFSNVANASLSIVGDDAAGGLTIASGFTNEGSITLTSTSAQDASLTVASGTLTNSGAIAIETGAGGGANDQCPALQRGHADRRPLGHDLRQFARPHQLRRDRHRRRPDTDHLGQRHDLHQLRHHPGHRHPRLRGRRRARRRRHHRPRLHERRRHRPSGDQRQQLLEQLVGAQDRPEERRLRPAHGVGRTRHQRHAAGAGHRQLRPGRRDRVRHPRLGDFAVGEFHVGSGPGLLRRQGKDSRPHLLQHHAEADRPHRRGRHVRCRFPGRQRQRRLHAGWRRKRSPRRSGRRRRSDGPGRRRHHSGRGHRLPLCGRRRRLRRPRMAPLVDRCLLRSR
ncbi:MAG: tandem-95 repeat protein [Rhodospirillales bacterium]|nr:tandem-95 repeat protein [Rhodospirillales bacterium]